MGCIGAFCGWKAAIFIVFFRSSHRDLICSFSDDYQVERKTLKDCGENSLGFGIQIPFWTLSRICFDCILLRISEFFDAFLDKTFAF